MSDPVPTASVAGGGLEVLPVATDAIEDTVLPLWSMGMSDPAITSRIGQRFEWLYRTCPDGQVRSWVVRDRGSNDVLGAGSVVPCALEIDGRRYRAGLLVDFIIHPRARSAGPAVSLQRALAEQALADGFELLFGYPNRKAWPIFARLGYQVIGSTRMWARSLTRDTPRVRRLLQSRLQRRLPAPVAETAARWLGGPGAWLAQGMQRTAEAAMWLRGAGAGARYQTSLRSLDGQWPVIEQPAAQAVQTDQSPDYLKWRYASHPTHHYRLFEVKRNGRLLAWAIVRTVDDSAEVQDVQWTGEDPRFPGLLWWLLPAAMRREGITVLNVNLAGDTAMDKMLSHSLFFEREDDRKVILRATPTVAEGLVGDLQRRQDWNLFAGALDI